MIEKIQQRPVLLALLGALLLFAGWPTSPFVVLLFVGFALLIVAANQMIIKSYSTKKYFGITYLALFTWNLAATWWILNATFAGMAMAVVFNSALMCIPFLLYRLSLKVKVIKTAPVVFITAWLGYEYLHQNWSINWPWLTLGNGFAKYPELVQWYEITGAHGGSLWILVVAFLIATPLTDRSKALKRTLSIFAVVTVPVLVSLLFLTKSYEPVNKAEVLVVQPNYNTYTQKSSSGSESINVLDQLHGLVKLSESKITKQTKLVVWPETAIGGYMNEAQFSNTPHYKILMEFLSKYPKVSILSGLDCYSICQNQQNPPQEARYSERLGAYYTSHNAALMMSVDTLAFYHKSKFVPGAEITPFPWLAKPLAMLLGGVGFGQFYGQEDIVPFETSTGIKVSPAICYESVFGEFMGEFVRNGAHLHAIVTNDDWWHDTQGHKQHFLYAGLRAIEARREIARSANTGTSGYFNVFGDYEQDTPYRESAVLCKMVNLYDHQTFYVAHGDFLARTAGYIAIILIISLFVKRFTPKNQ